MIKRVVIFSVLLMYLSTTVGFALSLHFCGTKISNIRINQSAGKPCCSKKAETKPDKCCNEKHIKIKVSDQQQTIQFARIPTISNLDLFIVSQGVLSPTFTRVNLVSQSGYRGPPVTSDTPLTIQNCVFRI